VSDRRRLIDLDEADLKRIIGVVVEERLAELRGAEVSPLVDRNGAGRLLGCSTRQIDRLVNEGAPFLLVGDAKRFERAELLEWLRSRRAGLRLVGGSRS
jgi:hypothetical protein